MRSGINSLCAANKIRLIDEVCRRGRTFKNSVAEINYNIDTTIYGTRAD